MIPNERDYEDDGDPLDTPIVPPPDDGDRNEQDADSDPIERARKLADELRNSAAQKIDSKRYPGGE